MTDKKVFDLKEISGGFYSDWLKKATGLDNSIFINGKAITFGGICTVHFFGVNFAFEVDIDSDCKSLAKALRQFADYLDKQ